MKKNLSILCPSRGRPKSLENFLSSVVDTAAHPERVEVLIYVDDDDETRFDYVSSLKFLMAESRFQGVGNIDLVVDEPLRTPLINNVLAERAAGDIFLIANDDQVFKTSGWDIRIDEEAAKFADEIYCMWFNDGRYEEKICTFPIVSRKWVETLGYLEPPIFEHFNCDLWIWQIATMIDRAHYIPDVLVEHLHPDTGKSDADETTERNLKGRRPERDRALFAKFERYRVLDASLLRDVIKS